MSVEVSGRFEVTAWDEHAFDRRAGAAKLTKARVRKTYRDGIDGESVTEWVMAYQQDGTARFVGVERIAGSVDGRTGTLVVSHVGTFADGAATAELSVIEGAGSGDFAGVGGRGSFRADPAGRVDLQLDLD